ncbi:MAG: CRISPR-associated protein Cas4 [Chloroflexi bacterium]|nr:CRISPR-associated protein Cas4 [Chloroflexota bacterium]
MSDETDFLTEDETVPGEGPAKWLLEVTDLKQYRYCPRVVFYRYCLPKIRPVTYKMLEGIRGHEEEAGREARRSLQLYGLPEGERLPSVYLSDPELGLHGRLDLLIARPNQTEAQELIPVEYKWSTRTPGPHFRLQLAAYACLLESWHIPISRGFIYEPLLHKVIEIPLTAALRRQTKTTVQRIRELIATTILPAPPSNIAPCVNCEFRRFCNDVL